MAREEKRSPELHSGYTGDEVPSVPEAGPAINTKAFGAEQNRGKRAPKEGSGAVVGSGAGAGGSGGDEDFDADPQGGGGNMNIDPAGPRPNRGGDAPVGGSR